MVPATAHTGAWPAGQGASYNKIAANIFSLDERFGEPIEGFEYFDDFTLEFYGEYGLTDKATVIVRLPYRELENRTDGFTARNSGIGDVDEFRYLIEYGFDLSDDIYVRQA